MEQMISKAMQRELADYGSRFLSRLKRDAIFLLDRADVPRFHFTRNAMISFPQLPDQYFLLPEESGPDTDARAEILELSKTDPGSVIFYKGRTFNDGHDIEIYGIDFYPMDDILMTIRHELIHSALAQCKFGFSDDDETFIRLAIIYDAGPENIPADLELFPQL